MTHGQTGNIPDCLLDEITIAAQIVEHGGMPLAGVPVCGFAGGQTERIDVRHDALHGATKSAAQTAVGNHGEGATESGDVEGFRRCHQSDAAPRRIRAQRGERPVTPLAIENQAAVDFIGADDQVMPFGQRGDFLQLRIAPGAADRVMWVT